MFTQRISKIFKNRKTENIKMSRLSGYHIMIVSIYFETIKDFINLELVCKKFGGNMEKFHFNPIPLNYKTIGYFPNIETLHLWDVKDENFGNGFMINREKMEIVKIKVVLKKEFFRIIVWFNVDFETFDRNKNRNIEFKNVTYTKNNRKKFGNIIPPSVRSIGDGCFSYCGSLSSVNIPSSVTSIGEYCFFGCSSLTSVLIPSSVTSIGDCCFSGCSHLSSVTIPSSITSIGDYCFSYCSRLNSVIIPSSVTLFDYCCFNGCSSLTSVLIPSSVKSIGYCCFNSCSSLSS
ncbi:leucine rich repeat containing protein BspA family protein, partial [Entamoeba invadens IP1]